MRCHPLLRPIPNVVLAMTPNSPRPADLTDFLLLEHGTLTISILGTILFLFGYFGLHWINRRRFYRRQQANPFPTYFEYWLVRNTERFLGVLFIFAGCFGLLCYLVGFIDWIDGPDR